MEGLFDDFFRRELTVKRPSSAHIEYGQYVQDDVDSTFSITASVQPVSTQDMYLLEEGYRDKAMTKLYTDTELLAMSDDSKKGDIVEIDGVDYLVINVSMWHNMDFGKEFYDTKHYKIICVKRHDHVRVI